MCLQSHFGLEFCTKHTVNQITHTTPVYKGDIFIDGKSLNHEGQGNRVVSDLV